jgi:hypothetical protein
MVLDSLGLVVADLERVGADAWSPLLRRNVRRAAQPHAHGMVLKPDVWPAWLGEQPAALGDGARFDNDESLARPWTVLWVLPLAWPLPAVRHCQLKQR